MRKISLPLLATIAMILMAGCAIILGPESTPQAVQPTVAPPTTSQLPTAESAPPPNIAPTSTQTTPVCATDPLLAFCKAPVADERDRFCVQKVPYTQIALPAGTTFESVDPLLICTDEGIRGGEQMITCRSSQINYAYDLKICNAACSVSSALIVGSGQCAEGYGYSAAGGCCWPVVPSGDAGCALFRVNIATCP